MVFLHGVLDVVVHDAKHLPATLRTRIAGGVKQYLFCGCSCLSGGDLVGSCDPYTVMKVGSTRRLRTTIVTSTTDPVWEERFEVQVADEADQLTFEIKDADVIGAEFLGMAAIPTAPLLDGKRQTFHLSLTDHAGQAVGHYHRTSKVLEQGELQVEVQFIPAEKFVAANQQAAYGQVPRTYFPMRQGNRVRLYHDAHQPVGPVPLPFSGGTFNEHSCWEDVHASILGAKRCIMITGWSVWTETMLKRTPWNDCCVEPLGELLLKKAEEGVTVLLMVWDDATNNMGLHSGLMATHDQETVKFFKDTKVKCFLCPRAGGTEDSYLQQFSSGTMFTHHQKTIIVDADPQAGQDKRRVVAFVGGLDLCDGRYDCGDHPLYETCAEGGPHCSDMHQACIEGYSTDFPAPREPWHDIHARVEGPVAWDVALNFVERWKQQAPATMEMCMRHIDTKDVQLTEVLQKFTNIKEIIKSEGHAHGLALKTEAVHSPAPPALLALPAADKDAWNVQLFRSIDSDAAAGFPKKDGAYSAGLTAGKGKSIDASIHRAYIHNIRRAERFIYIENQYFLGSCHLWSKDQDCGCIHQVPAEIALKIASKIKAGEDFCVYVVLPMYPEGIPTSGSVQAILNYQTQTMEMMYTTIAKAIMAAGSNRHPTDYLQFYCLGQREAAPPADAAACPVPEVDPAQVEVAANGNGTTSVPPSRRTTDKGAQKPKEPSPQQKAAHEARRFMIYVHSKMMIVDDEYIIVGSANINQRSMDGTRDTEIAIGAFQPAHTLPGSGGALPRGEVAGFRKVLWKEHCGSFMEEHEKPQSLECARAMLALGRRSWQAYIDPTPGPLPCHLMAYPVDVGSAGSVSPLPGSATFPDLGGNVVGTKGMLPPLLTT